MSELVEISAAELTRLRKVEAKYREKFCERCGDLSIRATVQTCTEEPCPRRHLLPPDLVEWRKQPGSVMRDRRLPALSPSSDQR